MTTTERTNTTPITTTPAAVSPRRRALGLAGLLVVVLAGLLASASPASAWQYAGSDAGRPGSVTATATVHVGKLNVYPIGLQLTLYGSAGPTVTRSPATTGAQDASIFYSVQRWNGSQWVQVTSQRSSVRIPAGVQQGREPALYVIPSSGTGYYRVVEVFTWYVAGTNSVLGMTTIVPHLASDQACHYIPCQSTAGYVWAG